MYKDMANQKNPVIGLNVQAISSDATTNGVALDTAGFAALTFIMLTGAVTAGDVTLLIEESDDNVTFTAVDDEFLVGTEAATTLDAANKTAKIGYVGKKRYARASVVTDNGANLTVGVVADFDHAQTQPVSDQTPA